MGWPECASVELEYEIVRRVGHAVDFFEHDVPLRLQITLPEKRPAHQIGQDLQRQRKIGIEDVCLSLPSIVDAKGVDAVLAPPLAEDEADALRRSAETVRDVERSLGL